MAIEFSEKLKEANGMGAQAQFTFVSVRRNRYLDLLQAMPSTYRRRLAITAKGYFALVPAESKVGDKVAILKGGKLPLIMRAKGNVYRLIGESYVHGIMNGEAWDRGLCEKLNYRELRSTVAVSWLPSSPHVDV